MVPGHRHTEESVTDVPMLEMKGITKRFPGVLANDDVDFDVRAGRGAHAAGRERRR